MTDGRQFPLTFPDVGSLFLRSDVTENNVWSMLHHRLRRWPSIKPALGEPLMFAGIVMINRECVNLSCF